MKRIVLDTNFLLAISQFHVDVFSEIRRICDFPYKLYVIDKTIDELGILAKTPSKKAKQAAKLALSLIGGRVEVLKTGEGYADDILAGMADKDTIIATQDKGLKRKIKSVLITIKQKKYLSLERT
ncbi:hypothetical protein FJZ53_06625 [Candidatus Woesearchaeota archaeon]|nr:hypothetical protein [Candidatus Woesearchaeota archaeon]